MSDREESTEPQENGSHTSEKSHSPSPRASRTPSPEGERKASRSPRSRSRSHSRSHSYSRTYSRRHGSYSRSRSRSHSRRHRHHRYSRSHSRSPMYRRYSRSRSRSYSPRRSYSPKYYSPRHSPYRGGKKNYGYNDNRSYYRSRSRSPMSNRRRHLGNRDDPSPSRCLGVFGLSLYTQERELKEVFSEYGHVKEVQVVYDAQSGRSRGFAFVYFETEDDAKMAKERCNGIEIDGRKIRVDYSITHRAHTPTPGIYMGKPTYPRGGGYRSGGSSYRGGRSPSPYRQYSRSRSRSYSPRIEDRSED